MESKECIKCGEVKGFSEFDKSKVGEFGRRSICKSCIRPKTLRKLTRKTKNNILSKVGVGNKMCKDCREELTSNSFSKSRASCKYCFNKKIRNPIKNKDLEIRCESCLIVFNRGKGSPKTKNMCLDCYRLYHKTNYHHNKPRYYAAAATRRAVELSAEAWGINQKKEIKRIYKASTRFKELFNVELHVDHIVPLNPKNKSVCGLHVVENLRIMFATENLVKHDKYESNNNIKQPAPTMHPKAKTICTQADLVWRLREACELA